ncbi:DNA-packaging protein [Sphingomonas turrisvirgatae]|uniref:ATP-binding protein n=1 Tax=Sphingomonas turrisvirgatae TaxID=1888892 RepID=A0A1E3LTD4_9SPHN|nr:terminase family protein [Sphingomonas turrisvirgatae]ODP37041.1 ATP-binding protein [Sphingomonas turrisvirgatae]
MLPTERAEAMAAMTEPMRRALADYWLVWAQSGQVAPAGDWRVWLIRAGRGFGKTRAGSEWLHELARRHPHGRFALVGATMDEVRRIMVEGRSGLIATAPHDAKVKWRRDAGELHFASGAIAFSYSAAAAEGLRGPEHHFAWCDELGKWGERGEAAWDNLILGLRLGTRPRVLVTTTPRETPLMRKVRALPALVETHGRTRDNLYLPRDFIAAMEAQHRGTRWGRQELDGEFIEDVEGALWTRAMIEDCRGEPPVQITRVAVGVDPPASASGDACGIVAVALDGAGICHVLEDASVEGASPERWATAVAACASRHQADRVVAEKNQGGDMVRSVLTAADVTLPVKLVHASRGKVARAEPVAAAYARGAVRHAGVFPMLEDELCGLVTGGGYEGPGRSPDRADALVWAVSELRLGMRRKARVERL